MNDPKAVAQVLARAVGSRKVSNDAIQKIAKQLASNEQLIRRLDVCAVGICIDYFIHADDLWKTLPGIVGNSGGRIVGIEIFPWGIINPDLFHVHVEHAFDEIARG